MLLQDVFLNTFDWPSFPCTSARCQYFTLGLKVKGFANWHSTRSKKTISVELYPHDSNMFLNFIFNYRVPGLLRQSLKFCEILSSYFENAVLSPGISLYIWDQNSKTKAIIRNPKTYRPSLWPTVTNGMSYSCLRSVSIKKRRYKRRLSLSLFCFI